MCKSVDIRWLNLKSTLNKYDFEYTLFWIKLYPLKVNTLKS